ncbi:hypothetical protein HPHPH21_1075 [Helicobacter pylori Hp H-21]|nr:hypothetical protein HPHPH21_1075 [Helicobacter pylori Hp H-21]
MALIQAIVFKKRFFRGGLVGLKGGEWFQIPTTLLRKCVLL